MRDVEEVLGRELGEEDFRKTRSYNELSSKQIQEALLLAGESRLVAAVYLRHCVEHSDGYDDFIDEVLVERLLTPEEWGKSRVICYPEIESAKCMQTPAEDLLAPLRGLEGERWFRVTPTLEDWMGFSVYPGAPGVVQDAPYWKSFDGRFGCSRFGRRLEAKIDFEQIDNDALDVALRRWIASRVARQCHRFEKEQVNSFSKVCIAIKLREETLSAVARGAIEGLLGEGWPAMRPSPEVAGDTLPPGFVGPDNLYRERSD